MPEKQDAADAHCRVKPAGDFALAEKQSNQDEQNHRRDGDALHADQKKPAAEQQIQPALALFLPGSTRSKNGVVQDHLPEHKGQVVNLQLQRIAIRITEGDQTGNERLDAGCKP